MKETENLRERIIREWQSGEDRTLVSDPVFLSRTAVRRILPGEDRYPETVAGILRSHGLLRKDQTVLDVGCGEGVFAAEAARTAGHVTGLDLSPARCEEARQRAARLGLGNVRLIAGDFLEFDPEKEGEPAQYDLVVASQVPAANAYTGFRKIQAMSRGSCFLSCPVGFTEPLLREIAARAAGEDPGEPRGRMPRFLKTFSLLCLEGFRPEAFFLERKFRVLYPTDPVVFRMFRILWPGRDWTEKEKRTILELLRERADSSGMAASESEQLCGCLLWKGGLPAAAEE